VKGREARLCWPSLPGQQPRRMQQAAGPSRQDSQEDEVICAVGQADPTPSGKLGLSGPPEAAFPGTHPFSPIMVMNLRGGGPQRPAPTPWWTEEARPSKRRGQAL
jgi:hypothetical protein